MEDYNGLSCRYCHNVVLFKCDLKDGKCPLCRKRERVEKEKEDKEKSK